MTINMKRVWNVRPGPRTPRTGFRRQRINIVIPDRTFRWSNAAAVAS